MSKNISELITYRTFIVFFIYKYFFTNLKENIKFL